MAVTEDKQIAKEILIKAIENNYLVRDEFPGTETTIDLVCKAYEKILYTIKKN